MSEKEEQPEVQEPATAEKEPIVSEQPNSESELDYYQQGSLDPQSDYDLEEEYLNKLRIQRKRIEELSLLYGNSQERIQREVQKNRSLQEEIQRLSSSKEYQSRYTDVMSSLEISTQENKSLKDQLAEVKQELLQSSSDKANTIQKLRMELAMQREKENSKIEHLEDQLTNKQEELDRLAKQQRLRQRELQDSISSLKNRISSIEHEYSTQLKNEQRKVERLERDLQTKNSAGKEAELNADALLKENVQLKEENYRLKEMLNSKDMELKSQFEKYKIKLNSMKKDIKAKEKECSEYKENMRKYQKEANEYTNQTESLRVQIRKIKDSFENDKSRWQADFSKEKQSLQQVVDRQNIRIMQLQADNKYLLQENKRLQEILKKKDNSERQRRYLLKNEMKQIDKLQKVIDRIVE